MKNQKSKSGKVTRRFRSTGHRIGRLRLTPRFNLRCFAMDLNEEQSKAAKILADVGSGKLDAGAAEAGNAYQVILETLQDIWNSRMSKGEDTIGLNWFGLENYSPLPEIIIIICVLAAIMFYVAAKQDVSTFDIIKPAEKKGKVPEESKKTK